MRNLYNYFLIAVGIIGAFSAAQRQSWKKHENNFKKTDYTVPHVQPVVQPRIYIPPYQPVVPPTIHLPPDDATGINKYQYRGSEGSIEQGSSSRPQQEILLQK